MAELVKHTIDDVIKEANTYIESSNLDIIKKAYNLAYKMHEGQFRKSGDPYIQHPIEVAYILTTLHTGPSTIAAALLHDVLEDTPMTKEEMASIVGDDVVKIVDGVTKISKLKYLTEDKALAADHQKILLAMANDIRVILVKICDRLHNMRTLQFHQDIEKRNRIAKETLDLYAPLAHRLGMYRIKAELEDLSLKYIHPEEYIEITKAINDKKSEREDDILKMQNSLEKLLKEHNIKNFSIKGRIKNIYSIYKKIITKNKTIDEIYDLLALRVIVNDVAECYSVLGIIHSEWTPIPMRFKDYIAVPKPNMYQSLHTTVVGVDGKIFEIQIRTTEMDEVAELGVAAHWAYKEGNNYSPEKEQLEIASKLQWYKDLTTYVEMSQGENKDPVDSLIGDLFSEKVYVFTPKGQVIDLPAGSMPLDFAYRIHSRVGDQCVGAIVNGKIVPLSYKLKTADVVEIKTNKSCPGPTKEWLKHCKSSHARHKIKSFINKKNREDLVEQGRIALEKAIESFDYPVPELTDKLANDFYSNNNIHTMEDLYFHIGHLNYSPLSVLNRICGISDAKLDDEAALKMYSEETSNRRIRKQVDSHGIVVDGLDRVQIKLANCCQPVHGDEIIGLVVKGKGIVVHRSDCPNCQGNDRTINIEWGNTSSNVHYDTTLKIVAFDKRNLVAEMINVINSTNAIIASVTSKKNDANECVTRFKLQVKDLEELNHVIVVLGNMKEILSIERVIK